MGTYVVDREAKVVVSMDSGHFKDNIIPENGNAYLRYFPR